jgi:hypothetical protein
LKKGAWYPLGRWISRTWRAGGSICIRGCATGAAESRELAEEAGATLDLKASVSGRLGATSLEWVEFADGSFATGNGGTAGEIAGARAEADELEVVPPLLGVGGASEEAVAPKVMPFVAEGSRSELVCDWFELRLCSNVVVAGETEAACGALRAFCAVLSASFDFCSRSCCTSPG